MNDINRQYDNLRQKHLNKQVEKNYLSYKEAVNNSLKIDWSEAEIQKPKQSGIIKLSDYPLSEIREYINWTEFFKTWGLKGKYPAIFDNPKYGNEARKLFDEANKLIDTIIDKKLLKANATFGIFPANSTGDDIEIYSDESRENVIARLHTLRQQIKHPNKSPNLSLADFIAPKNSGINDYIGAFALTTGLGADELAEMFKKQKDDYKSIMTKAIADRFAEAFAELLHKLVRKNYWGYAAAEKTNKDDLLRNKYTGIRPAIGYPSLPDHSEKEILFDLLQAETVGIKLTGSFMMMPAASVSGLYFSHPLAKYFPLGKILKDQIQNYAKRKGITVAEAEKWLAQNLVY